jgi:hypothetical protein
MFAWTVPITHMWDKNICSNPAKCMKNTLCDECFSHAMRYVMEEILKKQNTPDADTQYILQHGLFERLKDGEDLESLTFVLLSGIKSKSLSKISSWPIESINLQILQFGENNIEFESWKDCHETRHNVQRMGSLPYEGKEYKFKGRIWTRGL